ncbi:hypothetical protein RJ639_001477 [Escallonia herrerae]|uniref:Transcription repressor n=1 Tax=Escallonia herrerae TaxID=1293975 RepID=A0AA88X852_9ASTE|nr:hypothetical protein RJ639_001477 [Escallonia herrerae]
MENKIKLRISRMFGSSFASCRSKNISDVVEQPFYVQQNRQHYQLVDLFSPKPRPPLPSLCRPMCPETSEIRNSCIKVNDLYRPRRKVSDRRSLLLPADTDGRKCPPASPITPFSTFKEFQSKPNSKKSRKTRKKKKAQLKSQKFDQTHEFNYYNWCSSSDTDDETTLFSSKSLSSDSSESLRTTKPRRGTSRATERSNSSRAVETRKDSTMGATPLQGKVKDSFAVVKRSSDPHSDFRTSMVEMIVERQIFAAKDLENLLQCFLSLNSVHHHKVIVEVFDEICEALFSNWS